MEEEEEEKEEEEEVCVEGSLMTMGEEEGLAGLVEVGGGGVEGECADLEAGDWLRRTRYSEIGRMSLSRRRENELR